MERKRITEVIKKDGILSRVHTMEARPGSTVEPEDIFPPMIGKEFSSDVQYRRYSIDEIKEVTNNFSESLKIGEGGYGPVFKSTLDYTPVAIKIPRPDVARGMEQFQQEVFKK